MKTIIISDIKGKTESIIPYGLNLAKFLQTDVEIIHVIDSRVQQGVPSSYSDSHTVAPADKLSHDEIIEKEREQVGLELGNILSSESSRLNYPVKISVRIEETSIEAKIKNETADASSLLIINKEPDNHIFISQKEMIDVCKSFSGICLLIPPGQKFHEFSNILLPTDFSMTDLESYEWVSLFLKHFRIFINAVAVQDKEDTEVAVWKQSAEALFNADINGHSLPGHNFDDALISYILKIQPDLVVLIEREQGFFKNLFKKELILKILEKTDIPVLFHCP